MSNQLTAATRAALPNGARAGVCASCSRHFSTTASARLRSAASSQPYLADDSRDSQRRGSQKADRLVETLLGAASLGVPPPKPFSGQDPMAGWKHTPGASTRHNVGLAASTSSRRLRKSSAVQAIRDLRLEEEWVPQEDLMRAASNEVNAGDIIEMRRARKAMFGMVIPTNSTLLPARSVALSSTPTQLILLSTGELVPILAISDIVLRFPQYHSKEEAASAAPTLDLGVNAHGEANSTSSSSSEIETMLADEEVDVPRFERRAKLAAIVRDLQRAAEAEAQRLLPAFRELLLSPSGIGKDSKHISTISTYEAAVALERHLARDRRTHAPLITRPVYLATHQLLMSQSSLFLADPAAHRATARFAVRPDSEHDIIKVVTEWARAKKGETGYKIVENFCQRAIAAKSWVTARKAEGTAIQEPTASPAPDALKWSKSDVIIIAFLRICLGVRRMIQSDETTAIASQLLKRVGVQFNLPITEHRQPDSHGSVSDLKSLDLSLIDNAVSSDLGPYLLHRFLEDIGDLPSWHNMLQLDTSFRSLILAHSKDNAEALGDEVVDGLEDVRHDFGALPVYVIDEASARELDDGISVERVPEDPTSCWLHVHVADPTAVISWTSPIAQQAAQQQMTVYFPERSWPLLPTGSGTGGLRPTGSHDPVVRTLTFSAKVDINSGAVTETDVRAGVVRNVKVWTYSNVGATIRDVSHPADESSRADLVLLDQLTAALQRRRTEGSPQYFTAMIANVALSGLPTSPHLLKDIFPEEQPDRPIAYTGNLSLKLNTMLKSDEMDRGDRAKEIVSEAMVVAGRVAGKWAHERGVPLPYRGQLDPAPKDIQTIHQLHREAQERDGPDAKIDYQALVHNKVVLQPGYTRTTPVSHFSMAIPGLEDASAHSDALAASGYTRATSPLRRYADLIVHWQLKSALLPGSNGVVQPPWQASEVEAMLPRIGRQEVFVRQMERFANIAWTTYYLERLLATDPTNPALGPYAAVVALGDVRIGVDLGARVRVQVSALGLNGLCSWGLRERAPTVGEVLNVRVKRVIRAGTRSGVLFERVE